MTQYDVIAKSYEKLMGEFGDEPRKYLIDPLMRLFLPKKKNINVLDAGCGNGYWTIYLAGKYEKIVGIDSSLELLKICKKKRHSKNIRYQYVDLEDKLPFQDESFDFIFSNMVFHYVKNIDLLCKEMYRVLKENGEILISVIHPEYEIKKNPELKIRKNRESYKARTIGNLADVVLYCGPVKLIIECFLKVGFKLEKRKEALITEDVAKRYPRYVDFIGIPRSEILLFKK